MNLQDLMSLGRQGHTLPVLYASACLHFAEDGVHSRSEDVIRLIMIHNDGYSKHMLIFNKFGDRIREPILAQGHVPCKREVRRKGI